MTGVDAAAELRGLVELLRPDLAAELLRLQTLDHELSDALGLLSETARQLVRAELGRGVYHERAVRAERRLEDLGLEEISKARREAFLLGDSFVRVTSRGRGRFDTVHLPAERVIVRGR